MFQIVVGGIIKNNNKYLLVQEAKEQVRGKWSSPAGRLNSGESILDGAIREIKEECGLSIKLTGIIDIKNIVTEGNDRLIINFSTEIIDGSISYDPNEILDIKWFTYEEILEMKDNLRRPDLLLNTINRYENNEVIDINIIDILS